MPLKAASSEQQCTLRTRRQAHCLRTEHQCLRKDACVQYRELSQSTVDQDKQHGGGAFGNGIRMKLVANLLVAIHNVSTAEAILMGECSGLEAATIVKVIADGAGGSRMFAVRGPLMVDRSWGEATVKVSTW